MPTEIGIGLGVALSRGVGVPQALTWAVGGTHIVRSNSNRDASSDGAGTGAVLATPGKTSGKWYCEMTIAGLFDADNPQMGIGFGTSTTDLNNFLGDAAQTGSNGLFWWGGDFAQFKNVTAGSTLGSFTHVVGDVWMFAMDITNGKFFVGRNGTWLASGNPVTGANPWATFVSGGATWQFGANINTTADKLRLASTLRYPVPAGFLAP